MKWDSPESWVRFHSLPEGKRYADTHAKSQIILDRHLTVLQELVDSDEVSELLLIAQEWGPHDLAGGWTRHTTVEWWPWRTHTDPEQEEDEFAPSMTYFWAGGVATPTELVPLLRRAADNGAHFIVAPSSLDWIYAPYDGGADVLLSDVSRRDALATAHSDWLSPRADGF
ncbi:DUF3885 domain-containing protein [Leifsonia sp. McL0607]|uniref:DUF3885 domain-containing protein n=1 Tax=Leifsonia sp. McL0607 TaxID=3415672 RepID=UPI003CF09484